MEVHHHATAPEGSRKKWSHYFFEFFMLFLAIVCGFMAENFREKISIKENELHYINNLIIDLKKDTTEIVQVNNFQNEIYSRLDKLSHIPIDRLRNFNTQDTFYHHFLKPYSFVYYFIQRNNTISQLKAGGFNLVEDKEVIDSITSLYSFYESIRSNNEYMDANYRELSQIGRKTIKLENIPSFFDDPVFNEVLQNKEVFIEYSRPVLQQLYNVIAFSKASILNYTAYTEEYKRLAGRVILYLKEKYHLKE